jgi:TraY domain
LADAKRRPGRPKTRLEDGPGDYVGFRAPRKLKEQLTLAAEESGRSLSTEAQVRLESSFQAEDGFYRALELALGQNGAAVIQLLARAITEVGHGAGGVATNYYGGDHWLADPYAYDQVVTAMSELLEALRPEGDATPPDSPDWPPDHRKRIGTIGRDGAKRFLAAVAGQGEGAKVNDGGLGQWAASVRGRLGPDAIRRIAQRLVRS